MMVFYCMNYALISGASKGIGKEMAYLLAKEGYKVLLVARSEDLLDAICKDIHAKYGVEAKYLALDITKSYKDIYDYCMANKMIVDILINNAGFGKYGKALSYDEEIDSKMIDLNIKALTGLCKLFGKMMAENKGGHILNVASVAAFMPGPYMACYYASKSYVLNYSLALRQELKKDGVRVSVLCPSPTKTEFFEVAGVKPSKLYTFLSRSSKQAALTGFKCIKQNKAYMIDGIFYKTLILIMGIVPLSMKSKIISWIQSGLKT